MRALILIFFFPLAVLANDPPSTSEVRTQFFNAAKDPALREALLERMEESSDRSPLMTGYIGATKALVAEVKVNPYSKYAHFTDGVEMLEEAIKKDPDNGELRYLRFMIQVNTPDFLDYHDKIVADKKFIQSTITNSPQKESWMNYYEWFVESKKHTIEARLHQ